MAHRSFAKIAEAAGVIFRWLSSERSRPPQRRHCGSLIPRALSGPVDYNVGNLLLGQNFRGRQSDQGQLQSRHRRPNGKRASQPPNQQLPANLEGLLFWLDAGRLSPDKGRIQQAEESGPLRLRALPDGQSPFCIPFLNGQSAVFFPTTKATERQLGEHGLLRFVVPAGKCSARRSIRFQFVPLSNRTFRLSHTDAKGEPSPCASIPEMQTQSLFSNGTALFRHRGRFFAPITDTAR